jgi:hypothetical protein
MPTDTRAAFDVFWNRARHSNETIQDEGRAFLRPLQGGIDEHNLAEMNKDLKAAILSLLGGAPKR